MATSPTATPTEEVSGGRLLAAMCGCVVVVQSIVAAVNLAVPPLTHSSLQPTPVQVMFVVDAYILTYACLLVPAGVAASRLGHRRLLLIGLCTYAVGCLACAVAPTSNILIAARGLSGCGAAMVLPTSLSTLTEVLPPNRRGTAVATWTASTFLGGAVGNVVAGATVHYGSWHALFVVQGAAAVLLLPVVGTLVPRTRSYPRRFDVAGTVVFTVLVASLLYGIICGSELGWTSVSVLAAFAVAACCLAAFIPYELRRTHPMVDLRLFTAPLLRGGSIGTLLLFVGMAALFLGNSQFLQYGKGFSPMRTGLASLPLAVGLLIASRLSVLVVARLGARAAVGLGLAAVFAGLGCMFVVGVDTPYPLYAGILTLIAIGTGLASPTLSAGIMSSVDGPQAGAAAGINSLSREVGSALGVAVFGTITVSRFGDFLADRADLDRSTLLTVVAQAPPGGRLSRAFTHAMGAGYLVLAVIIALAAVLIVVGWRSGTRPASPTGQRVGPDSSQLRAPRGS